MMTAALTALRKLEADRGLDSDGFYQGFNARMIEVLQGARAWLAAKQGRLLPGSHIPHELLALQPDEILILPSCILL
ncbi:MAG: hypothetical protein U5N10_05385 [Gemmobacter sp.]|nr:hypothetical protein [Gemmobacter sp.]